MTRKFETGATRDDDANKLDYEGALDPAVLQEFALYMHGHRHMPDGSVRTADNWQNGFPLDVYMKSMMRHVLDLWLLHREREVKRPETDIPVTVEDALGGIMFNVQGYWSVLLKQSKPSE